MSTLGYQKHCKSLKKSVGRVPAPSPAPSSTSAFWLQTSAFGRQQSAQIDCCLGHKIHYLTGVEQEGAEGLTKGENLTLEAGEYVVVRLDDPDSLRDTWIYLLGSWLPASGRKEKHAPEFERYTSISEAGTPVGR